MLVVVGLGGDGRLDTRRRDGRMRGEIRLEGFRPPEHQSYCKNLNKLHGWNIIVARIGTRDAGGQAIDGKAQTMSISPKCRRRSRA